MRVARPNIERISKDLMRKFTLMNKQIKPYPPIEDKMSFFDYLESDYILGIVEDIRMNSPDLITLQGVHANHELLISIEGYESVFYLPKNREIGYVTLWKPSKFQLVQQLKLDYFIYELNPERPKCTGALITLLEVSENTQKLLLANSNFLETSIENSECSSYILLNQLKNFQNLANHIIVSGEFPNAHHVFCQEKLNLSKISKNLIPRIYFLASLNMTEAFVEKKNKLLTSPSGLSGLDEICPFQIYSKGSILFFPSVSPLPIVFSLN